MTKPISIKFNGHPVPVCLMVRPDERPEDEERVKERTRQVRTLASTLTMAEQQERHRISRILHDNLQQLLYGIQLKISGIHRSAEKGKQKNITAKAAEAHRWFNNAIRTTRQLTVDLSPPVLKGEGLFEALQWLSSMIHDVASKSIQSQKKAAAL